MVKEKGLSHIDDVVSLIAPIISHEVRNPLAIIGNSSYFIKTKLSKDGDIDPKVEKHISIIETELLHANEVFTKMIGYARMPEAQPKSTNLTLLVESAAAEFEGVKISGGKGLSVFVDAELTKTALRNTIENAVQSVGNGESKDGGGKVQISLSQKKETALVEIVDSGKGIPPEALERMFLPFNTTKPRGIGVGLAYARKALERQKGKIELGKAKTGARILITLPLTA